MFDTSILDESLRIQREKRNRERLDLLQITGATLQAVQAQYGMREAYICGSLLSAQRWHQASDIDVAVGGCSAAVLDVMKALEDTTGKAVDVIDLDRHPHPDSFRDKGLKVYG